MTFRPENYLYEASDLIETAEINLRHLKYKGTINRSYYSIFNCVQAFVLSEGFFVKTHSGLKTKFSELFIKTGKCDVELSKQYGVLFKERLSADYDPDASVTLNDAQEALSFPQNFYAFTVAYFKK